MGPPPAGTAQDPTPGTGNKPRLTVSVADNGMGIAPENRARLFAEFFTTKGSRGTGLGLSVTKKLIEGMGGRIAFHSVVGRGTRFVLGLPLAAGTDRDADTEKGKESHS